MNVNFTCRQLQANDPSLTRLTFFDIDDDAMCKIANACASNTHVRELDLHCPNLSSKGCQALSGLALSTLKVFDNQSTDSIPMHDCVEEFWLERGRSPYNKKEKSDVRRLTLHSLRLTRQPDMTRTMIQHLDLAFNQLDGSTIGDLLRGNRTLQSLTLHHNHIDPVGVEVICKALAADDPSATFLEVLDLSWNPRIGDEGAQIIADFLPLFKRLKILQLHRIGSPSLEESTCQALVQAMQQNLTLQQLKISDLYYGKQLDYLGRLNKGHRWVLRQRQCPRSWWPRLLAQDDVDVIYYFLQEMPSLVKDAGTPKGQRC